eukprot:TRINITY_DN804_c0_g1_i1.p2 TRINITY_DN804_c0_g1~~TRINITY_DN804_c0_g1_i1.p2  ORF type:complete len:154 (-),score=41.16 TRINITY_DN804_c0_g1_i1:115-576(-)
MEAREETPLQNAWSFWHYKPPGPNPTPEAYESALKTLCSFSTVEGFWRCFNNLPSANLLHNKNSFSMMKEGVKPLWEDPSNAEGGFWVLRVSREDTQTVWKELLLAAIGEQFCGYLGEEDDICGVTGNLLITHQSNQIKSNQITTIKTIRRIG